MNKKVIIANKSMKLYKIHNINMQLGCDYCHLVEERCPANKEVELHDSVMSTVLYLVRVLPPW